MTCDQALSITLNVIQQTTAIAETTIAETTTIEDKLSEKTTVLEEIELGLFTGFEDTTALEDKKSLTVFSAIVVVGCISSDYTYSKPCYYWCYYNPSSALHNDKNRSMLFPLLLKPHHKLADLREEICSGKFNLWYK